MPRGGGCAGIFDPLGGWEWEWVVLLHTQNTNAGEGGRGAVPARAGTQTQGTPCRVDKKKPALAADFQQVIMYDQLGNFAGVRIPQSGRPIVVDGYELVVGKVCVGCTYGSKVKSHLFQCTTSNARTHARTHVHTRTHQTAHRQSDAIK